ncbi:Rsa1p ASCRUDRAFT_11631 [Ascoidea rubescens DSM 1968]|uniref:FMR1-interacting protein 1 conserved domain-containing protein n=1 Tax=Ascoidea rubescens DSM 1968 TaxID=1344418 RepID=A0A1D2VRR6_9ASCO|nr:hypothetical protein ASCRUDRAFT_11631 [Ascoidea rubescens DSM 1968]ODV64303.1 hypothetical protein ASCRUDRAFT_11631 [Ascoidea rubescens DSM 1968]
MDYIYAPPPPPPSEGKRNKNGGQGQMSHSTSSSTGTNRYPNQNYKKPNNYNKRRNNNNYNNNNISNKKRFKLSKDRNDNRYKSTSNNINNGNNHISNDGNINNQVNLSNLPTHLPNLISSLISIQSQINNNNNNNNNDNNDNNQHSESENEIDEEALYLKNKGLTVNLDSEKPIIAIPGTNIVLQSDDDIQLWIEERKKNWPTNQRIKEKKLIANENKNTIQTGTADSDNNNNRSKFNKPNNKLLNKDKFCHNLIKFSFCKCQTTCQYNHDLKLLKDFKQNQLLEKKLNLVPQKILPMINNSKNIKTIEQFKVYIPERFDPTKSSLLFEKNNLINNYNQRFNNRNRNNNKNKNKSNTKFDKLDKISLSEKNKDFNQMLIQRNNENDNNIILDFINEIFKTGIICNDLNDIKKKL